MKVCTTCRATKPADEFHRDPRTKDRLASSCKACAKERTRKWRAENKERKAETDRAYREKNAAAVAAREKARREREDVKARNAATRRRRDFGITPEEHAALLQQQEGLCALCRRPPGKRELSVDHDHATGAVRALLCANCNLGLGHFRDDPALLAEAIAYLARHAGA